MGAAVVEVALGEHRRDWPRGQGSCDRARRSQGKKYTEGTGRKGGEDSWFLRGSPRVPVTQWSGSVFPSHSRDASVGTEVLMENN